MPPPRLRAVAVWLLLLMGWLMLSSGPSFADCAAPHVDIPDTERTARGVPVVYPGSTVSLQGEDFFTECNDTGTCVTGGRGGSMQDVRLGIAAAEPGDEDPHTWEPMEPPSALVTVDADDAGHFSVEGITMPDQAGRYALVYRRLPGWPLEIAGYLWIRDP